MFIIFFFSLFLFFQVSAIYSNYISYNMSFFIYQLLVCLLPKFFLFVYCLLFILALVSYIRLLFVIVNIFVTRGCNNFYTGSYNNNNNKNIILHKGKLCVILSFNYIFKKKVLLLLQSDSQKTYIVYWHYRYVIRLLHYYEIILL